MLLLCLFSCFGCQCISAQDSYIGEIRMFAGNFAPFDWAICDGSLLSISEYDALYSIIGTTYGGDGVMTFALPDLRGRLPMHSGTGSGLSSRTIGEKGGAETTTLTVNQMPAHSHLVNAVGALGNQNDPTLGLPANTNTLDKEYSNSTPDVQMKTSMIGVSGGNQAFYKNPPYLAINFIISLYGIYPTQY
jgi:microcystin-dependent protein